MLKTESLKIYSMCVYITNNSYRVRSSCLYVNLVKVSLARVLCNQFILVCYVCAYKSCTVVWDVKMRLGKMERSGDICSYLGWHHRKDKTYMEHDTILVGSVTCQRRPVQLSLVCISKMEKGSKKRLILLVMNIDLDLMIFKIHHRNMFRTLVFIYASNYWHI